MKNNGHMKACIIGLGRFGAGLARSLATQCQVLAIDADMERVNHISDDVQVARCLDVRDAAALRSVLTNSFELAVVSIAEELEASILCTLQLKHLGVPRIIAKARNEDHAEILRAVGATEVVFPEREYAERLALRLLHPNLLDYLPVAGRYRVMDVAVPEAFVGHTLIALDMRRKFGVFVIGVRRNGEFTFLPGPEFGLASGDNLVVIGEEEDILALGNG